MCSFWKLPTGCICSCTYSILQLCSHWLLLCGSDRDGYILLNMLDSISSADSWFKLIDSLQLTLLIWSLWICGICIHLDTADNLYLYNKNINVVTVSKHPRPPPTSTSLLCTGSWHSVTPREFGVFGMLAGSWSVVSLTEALTQFTPASMDVSAKNVWTLSGLSFLQSRLELIWVVSFPLNWTRFSRQSTVNFQIIFLKFLMNMLVAVVFLPWFTLNEAKQVLNGCRFDQLICSMFGSTSSRKLLWQIIHALSLPTNFRIINKNSLNYQNQFVIVKTCKNKPLGFSWFIYVYHI